MKKTTDINSLNDDFDYSAVPGWYTLCFNADCPLHGNCMRFLAGSHAPETLETCRCVLPHTQKDGHCRWFDKIEVMTMAAGFTHLYDNVLKSDFTSMRKTITAYLHGVKFYYQYMRGERPLTPAQQQGIRDIIKSYGYDWDVPFDGYHKAYCFGNPPTD